MSVHVFAGPTMPADAIRGQLEDAVVFGPAAFGDVYRSAKARPRAIAIIDGYFEHVPAIWHKEILWAMCEGVHVFGASSMGALRAAELADFGMHGVGVIYEAYKDGVLEDDDEVTIAHASAEEGFAPASEAMVNVRATVSAAVEAGVVSKTTGDALVLATKNRFYPDRSYAVTLKDAESQGADLSELRAFRTWLPSGRVDQKGADARLLLAHLRAWLLTEPKAMRTAYRVERTDAWLEGMRTADAHGGAGDETATADTEALEEELKLAGTYASARDGAAARASAVEEGRNNGFRPDLPARRHAVQELRRNLGLVRREDFDSWRARQGIDEAVATQLFEDEAHAVWARPAVDARARAYLVDWLRVTGQYGDLAKRAERKSRRLTRLGPRGPSLTDLKTTDEALWEWYFEEQRGRGVPDDLNCFARGAGFVDKDDMRAALLRELYFVRSEPGALEEPG